jgi:hypothetical protein
MVVWGFVLVLVIDDILAGAAGFAVGDDTCTVRLRRQTIRIINLIGTYR